MNLKRWLAAIFVSCFLGFLLIVLLFQSGADERLVSTLLPSMEKKLGVKISYSDIDASLTSLTISGIELRSESKKGVFAKIERIVISVRIGPLLLGDLDVTGVRADGLTVKVCEGAGGASIKEWLDLAKRFAGGAKPTRVAKKDRPWPEIYVASGKLEFDDGRFSFDISDLSGRVGSDGRAVLEIDGYELRHGNRPIVGGRSSKMQYSPEDRRVTVRLEQPSFNILVDSEPLLSLVRDAGRTVSIFRDASAEADKASANGKTGGSVPLVGSGVGFMSGMELKVIASKASGTLIDRIDPTKQVPVEDVTIEMSTRSKGGISIRARGGFSGTDTQWTVGATALGDENPRIAVEAPDIPLKSIGDLFFHSGSVRWNDAFADGAGTIEATPDWSEISALGQINISGLAVQNGRISKTPIVGLEAQTDFKVVYEASKKVAHIERFSLLRGLTRVTVRGDVSLDRMVFDLSLNLPPTGCRQVLGAVPQELRPGLAGLGLDGQIAIDMRLAFDEAKPDQTILEATLDNRCEIVQLGDLPEPNYLRGPFSYTAYNRSGDSLRLITGPGTDRWTPLSLISPWVIEAVLTTEDGKFWDHEGVTLPEVKRAMELNLKSREFKHGASTITMQLAKNLFLGRERTVERKFEELVLTWYLEKNFSKEEILELYLNAIEFGPSIYGVRDAAMYYFGREPIELNAIESLFLIKLLPSPVIRHDASYGRGGVSERQMAALRRVLSIMKSRGRLTEEEYKQALEEEILFRKEGEPLPEPRQPVQRAVKKEMSIETIEEESDGGVGEVVEEIVQ